MLRANKKNVKTKLAISLQANATKTCEIRENNFLYINDYYYYSMYWIVKSVEKKNVALFLFAL